jgi:hypothetical protein
MIFCTEFLGCWWSHGKFRTAYTTYAAALKTTIHPKTRCRNPYAATQHLILLMMAVCTRNISSEEYINKITQLHQVGVSNYFIICTNLEFGFILNLRTFMNCDVTTSWATEQLWLTLWRRNYFNFSTPCI